MFKRILVSSEPEIIGVTNGIYQVELIENKEFKYVYNKMNTLFHDKGDIDTFEQIKAELLNFNFSLTAKLLPNAKLTDFMGYAQYIVGFPYLISQNVMECLKESKVPQKEYFLLKVNIKYPNDKPVSLDYYLIYVPWIPSSEIIFSKSLIYDQFKVSLSGERTYIPIKTYKEYLKLEKNNPFLGFDKIVLPAKYKRRKLINLKVTTDYYFHNTLVERLLSKAITGIEIASKPELHFV